ncbi:MAG TPA: TlpA disulfide reductase family protein [Sediminibacterium sp.]|nr:TlpA disulfide reductase family protein [Sediminibacterium sp.]
MKSFLLFIGASFTSLLALAQSPGYQIDCTVKNVKENGEVLLVNRFDGKTIATAKVKNGAVQFKGHLDNPDLLQLKFPGFTGATDLFIGNEKVTVAADPAAPHFDIKGSEFAAQYGNFLAEFTPYFTRLQSLVGTINGGQDPSHRDSLIQVYNQLRNQAVTAAIHFGKKQPNSPVSALVLFATQPLFEGPLELESAYNTLGPEAHKGSFAVALQKKIDDAKIGMVGSQALDFTQKDINGKPVSLSSFRGKYVLVDFWASWCRPCRAENPNVVMAYNQYKSKNFTVLGVSLDQQKANWLEAIKADNLSWTHVSDLQYWNNAVAQLYHIQSIPSNMLIDPKGKIIARDIRGEELQQKLKEVLK